MRHPVLVLVPSGLLVLLAGVAWQASKTHQEVFDDAGVLQCDAEKLKATVVTPHLEVPLEQGTNVLWCGTFQLAWNEACALVGEDLRFAGPEPQMVRSLNNKSFTKAEIDKASYVAVADFVRNGVHQKIRSELKKRFAGRATPKLIPPPSLTPRPQDIVCYCYLFKNLEFGVPFERLDEPLAFGGTDVSCFGIGAEHKSKHTSMYPQVVILDYRNGDDFVIELRSKAQGDRFILAKTSAEETLAATIAAVQDRVVKSRPVRASPGDVLKVPKLNFDITRRYSELEQLRLVSSSAAVAKDLRVLSAMQNTRFQLDEKGVRLRSESHLAFGCAAEFEPPPGHLIVFDKPFLIMLMRVGTKAPYFALWVDNAEVLVRAR